MAKIDVSKIDGYEGMTPEDKVKALEAFEYEDNLSEVERYKNAVTKANSEAAEWKKKHNALLSEEEQAKAAREEELSDMKSRLESFEKEKTIATYTAKYTAQGYDESLAAETAQAFVDGDMDKVFANQKKFIESHDKSLKASLLKDTPKPPAGGKPEGKKLEFGKMSLDEIQKYYTDHPEEKPTD